MKKFQFSESRLEEIKTLTKHYPKGKEKSVLIPLLHIAQGDAGGWLSVDVLDCIAGVLNITPIEVYEVVTFYTMFNLKPVGNFVLEVCQTGPCMLKGSDEIIEYIKDKLNIEIGQTTEDGMFSLKAVECLGACGYAPMLQIGKYYHEYLTKEKVDEILEQCRISFKAKQNIIDKA
ncbi:MAG: NADH-quinone oxidoreductase subunit NuoE [Chitinophagaceae bacterium]